MFDTEEMKPVIIRGWGGGLIEVCNSASLTNKPEYKPPIVNNLCFSLDDKLVFIYLKELSVQ